MEVMIITPHIITCKLLLTIMSAEDILINSVKGISKENKKLLNTFEDKMGEAFTFRVMAVKIEQDGFNVGVITPKNANEM
jgi:hypothetical protein